MAKCKIHEPAAFHADIPEGGPRPAQATVLYVGAVHGDQIHERTLAGIRRCAVLRGWNVRCVEKGAATSGNVVETLRANHPVAGCIVEASDDNSTLPPRCFGRLPTVYFHASPALRRTGAVCIGTDNEAIARAAFSELASGRPNAYAAVGVRDGFFWSRARVRAFRRLAAETGAACHVFPTRNETKSERLARLAAWMAKLPPKTAVFAVNDFTAAYVTAAARMSMRPIPRDVTVVGVDNNVSVCESSSPAISSIRLDHERAGFLAARMLGEEIRIVHKSPIANCSQITNGKSDLKFGSCGHLSQLQIVNNAVGPLMVVWRRSTGGRGRREPFVMEAVDMIRREACEGLTAEALAARFPVSQRLFNLRFREAVGHSVLDEIQHVRLETAFALLSRTGTAIGAIAGMCGYRTEIALKWIFRKKTGMSMSEWRRRNGR